MTRTISVLLATASLGLSGAAHAAITVFSSQSDFNGAITSAQTDGFDDLDVNFYDSPIDRALGSYSYQISAPNGLFPGSDGGNVFMSLNTASDPLTFSNFTGGVSAIGGFFFGSDISGTPTSASAITLTVTDDMGSLVEVILNPNTSSFRGFASTGTITSLTAVTSQPSAGFVWPSADTLTLAQAAIGAVPEPSTWTMLLLGFGVLGSAMRRRKVTVTRASLA